MHTQTYIHIYEYACSKTYYYNIYSVKYWTTKNDTHNKNSLQSAINNNNSNNKKIKIMPIIYTTTNDLTSTIYHQLVRGIEKQATQTSSAVETAGGRSHSGDLRNK